MSDNVEHPSAGKPTESVREVIARSQPSDYDGHTHFASMPPSQRLAWLDQAVLFIASRKRGSEDMQLAEDPPQKPQELKRKNSLR